MASVNPLSRELVFKIVYYGPGLGGKTTTLEHIHATAKPELRGKLVSLATPIDRTLYFDFLPVRLPPIRGMNVRLQLFTVPGQVYFNATRKLVLTGSDGIVFVSDSQAGRADANAESLENLRDNLLEQGRDIDNIPLVFQYNKRDLPDVLPVEELGRLLNPRGLPFVEASAKTGEGVYEALEAISRAVIQAFETRLPDSVRCDTDAPFEPIEEGLIIALRDASALEQGGVSKAAVTHLASTNRQWETMPPDAIIDDPPATSPPELPAPPRDLTEPVPASVPSPAAPPSGQNAANPPAMDGLVSFADLWPEPEQGAVREAEAAIATERYARAIELCEALVSRVLASAAGLFGSSEAPRDPAVVPMLLGLDGRRYLTFRSIVREARSGALLTRRDALGAFAFAIHARIARSAIP